MPFRRKNFIKCVGDFHSMSRECAVTYAHIGDLCKRRLESRHKLCFELAVNFVSCVRIRNIAADVCVKEHGIGYVVRVFAVAADCYIYIKSYVLIDNSERYGICRSVFVSGNFLGVEIIHAC